MQELRFMTPEILDRVNAFLEEERFQEVHLSLLGKRRPLNALRLPEPPATVQPPLFRPDPEQLGALWDSMDPDTPIGRCYRAYVRRFGNKIEK